MFSEYLNIVKYLKGMEARLIEGGFEKSDLAIFVSDDVYQVIHKSFFPHLGKYRALIKFKDFMDYPLYIVPDTQSLVYFGIDVW
jgi:hypothetical protein